MAALSAALRARSAMVKGQRTPGGKKGRYPLPVPPAVSPAQAVRHAALALGNVDGSAGLSGGQRRAIKQRAHAIIAQHAKAAMDSDGDAPGT